MDKYIPKARFMLFGADDELKNDSKCVYITKLNSFNFPVPVATASAVDIEGNDYNTIAVNFTERINTKRYRFTIDNSFKNLKLTNKARLVIESISVPSIISKSFLQNKCIGNILVKFCNIPNNAIYDSTTKGRGGSVIFSAPIKVNTQGFGIDDDTAINPDAILSSQKSRIQYDNNGQLYINPNPNILYNFPITDDWLKNGIFEFEIIYDISNCIQNTNVVNEFNIIPQQIVYSSDKEELERFQISMIILDYENDDKIYNEKELLNSINKIILKK